MKPATALAEEGLREVEEGGWREVVARVGLIAKGVSFALVGVLAIKLAVGDGGKATSRQGALSTIADEGVGKVVLVLLALGFAGYALWRFADAAFGPSHEDDDGAKKIGKRLGYAGRGLIYAALTYTTVKLLVDAGSQQSQNREARKATAEILDWPAGTWLVGIVGVCLIGAGAFNAYRGATKKFLEHWRENLGESARRWGTRAGVVGLLARCVVFTLIGIFVVKAAAEYDPKEAIGLDGALQKLAGQGHGQVLLGLVAAGLLAYAVFCFAESRYRQV
jgi:Domain of Unknown Function (DUF1206)